MDTHARKIAVVRACEIAGGAEALGECIGLSRLTVKAMLEGKIEVPQTIFLDLVDIITAADLRDKEGQPRRPPATHRP